ncbi:MAG: 3-hydroxyacyl-CoA dehydrogenase NAD-binding domain-containing protein [Bacteroidota bacterium]|nr:3-hydroxyacyl-CoA dehydrogenase NAD-binding domain-containing protein [Bacteroidota bacterium]MDX5430584.1 3-hydroxyacyl-CoA dehydrogenase NAD-binding domain-containing protein [Bacteroidota bacterium]MDX5469336.1 3-hydroxyacyl-CoA dehydrogenase NAD-binding domain-containing protein [Bacteroidota bacterium]
MNKVAVIGAGTMGSGIAQVFAMAGFETMVYDLQTEAVERAQKAIHKNLAKAVELGKLGSDHMEATLSKLTYTTVFSDLKADFIIEAILEKLDLKIDLFNRLAAQNEASCIFATNTSSIPITQIAAKVDHPERVVGVHFFNPAHIMKLVEIISGAHTDEAIAAKCYDLIKQIGKTPVMAKDAPGFIVNRVARHYYVEGLKVMEENVADFEQIDTLMENIGFKMGPFRLMDLIGVDTNFSVTSSMYALFHQDGKFRPSRIQQQKVDAGHHGRKSGRGFYSYE